jgi:phosphoserine aminotransferase
MTRPFNFAAGPGVMPEEVLAEARQGVLDWQGTGMSVLEMPFTGPEFKQIQARAMADLRRLLAIPDDYRILFLQGGAYAHFAFVPMNLLRGRRRAAYVDTGHWSRRAITEARRYCRVDVAASAEPDGFTRVPPRDTWRLDADAAYCHVTLNETANGLAFHWTPDTGELPLVADATSDFLSRPLDVRRYGLVYASAQKNLGPAGLTVVVARQDLLGKAMAETPAVFDYRRQADDDSRVNTPPTFAVYVAGLVFQWLARHGGLAAMQRKNRRLSGRLYAAIDASGFYRCPVDPAARSLVNVCFRLPEESLEAEFLARARARNLLNLKGHPATGGVRASLYNAMPEAGVDALIAFMQEFSRRHGASC